MTQATVTQMSQLPGMMLITGYGEMVVNTSDYDSGELTIKTGFSKIWAAIGSFRESTVLDTPPIWCDFTTTAGVAVFKCANVDQVEISFIILGHP